MCHEWEEERWRIMSLYMCLIANGAIAEQLPKRMVIQGFANA